MTLFLRNKDAYSHMLTGSQRRFLRGLAQPKKTALRIGRRGVTEGVVAELRRILDREELIKIRYDVRGEGVEEALEQLVGKCDAEVAGKVGSSVILYRPREDGSGIELP